MSDNPFAAAAQDLYRERDAQSANSNLASVQDVTPQNAAVAVQSAPDSGIPAVPGMRTPELTRSLAQQQENARIIAAHPVVAKFVATSPVHAAAAKDSLPQLADVSQFISSQADTLVRGASDFYKNLFEPAVSSIRSEQAAEAEQQDAISRNDVVGTLSAGSERLSATTGLALSPLSGPINALVADPLASALSKLVPYASGAFIANAGFENKQNLKPTEEESKEYYKSLFNTVLGFVGSEAVGDRGPLPGMLRGDGPPPIDELGLHLANEKGFLQDSMGKPYVFATKQQAAVWAKENVQPTGQDFIIHTDTGSGLTGIKVTTPPLTKDLNEVPAEEPPEARPSETATADEIIAEDTQKKLTSLQEIVDAAPMSKASPEVMKEFLDQHGLGDTTVYIDPEQMIGQLSSSDLPAHIDPYDVSDAYETGQKFSMSLSDYLTLVSKVPAAKNLIQHTSFAPDEPTQRELEATARVPVEVKPPAIPHLGAWYYQAAKPGGSQPGAFYHDENGDEWLVKGSDKPNPDRARNEVLASQLMKEAGIPAPEMKLIELGDEHGGGLGVASKRAQIEGIHAKFPGDKKAMQEQFAVHAWLGNRDVIGTGTEVGGSDNSGLMNGEVTHFDPGGAMLFRAMGEPKKDFGPVATEWDSLRDSKYPHSHAWFGDMTADQLQASASHLLMVSDERIIQLVQEAGLPTSLADTLIARKDDILLKGGVATPEALPVAKTFAAKVEGAIAKVAGDRGIDKLFTEPKAAGMTKKRFNLYGNAVENAFEDLKDKLFAKILKRIQRDYKKQYNDAYARHLNDATSESLDHPVMKANYSLRFTTQGETLDLTKDNEFVKDGQPITFYHSSNDPTIGAKQSELKLLADAAHPNPKLNPIFKTKDFKVISFTTEKEFNYGHRNIIYVVHLKGKKIGDAARPEDVNKAAAWLQKNVYQDMHIDTLKGMLRDYSWPLWENLDMQKALGWEGSYMKESPAHYLNANVQSGNQVYFKYALPQDAIKLKIALADRANYPAELTDKLPRTIFGKQGVTADQVAVQFGVGSGQELLEKIAQIEEARGATPFRKWHMDEIKREANRRTVEEVGNLLDPARIMQDARDAFDEPTIEHLLIDRLKDLRKEIGGNPFEPGMVKADAQRIFDNLTAKEAVNYKKFQAGMKAKGDKLQDALLADKILVAFQEAQAQLYNFYQLKMANDFAKTFVSGVKVLRQLRGKNSYDNVEANILRVIQARIAEMKLPIGLSLETLGRDLDASDIKDIQSMVAMFNQRGIDIDYAPLPRGFASVNEPKLTIAQFAKYLTSREFIDQVNMIKALAKEGREWNTVIAGEERAELSHVANQVVANAGWIGGGRTPAELRASRRAFFGAVKAGEAIIAQHLRIETILDWADQGPYGKPYRKYVVNPMMEGKYLETDLGDRWVKALTDFEGAKEVHNSMHMKISAPPEFTWHKDTGDVMPIEFRGQMLYAVAHLGTPLGRMKLFKGFNISEEFHDGLEKWLLAQPTPAETIFLQRLWGQYKELFPLADANQRDTVGYGLDKQPHRLLVINGHEMEGGYIPISYDQDWMNRARAQGLSPPSTVAKISTQTYPVSASPSNGYTKQITGFIGPLDLNWMNFASQGSELIHDIAFRKPLLQAQKILMNGKVGESLELLLGNEYQKQLIPWLRYVAQERMFFNPAVNEAGNFVQAAVNNMSYAHIAWQLHSALKHLLIGTSHMLGELHFDTGMMAQGFRNMVGDGPRQQETRQWVHDTFGEVRGSKWNLDASLHDMLGRNPFGMNALSQAKEMGTLTFTIFKQLESYMVAYCKYFQEMDIHGDHDDAVAAANKAVRDTQGAGHPVDQAGAFQKGVGTIAEEAGRATMRFMTFENTGTQRQWTASQQLRLAYRKNKEGDKESASKAAGAAVGGLSAFWVVPALLMAFFDVVVQGHGDRKKDLGGKLAEESAWSLGKGSVGSLGIANVIFDTLQGVHEGGQFGAWGDLLKSAVEHPTQKRELAVVLMGIGEALSIPDNFARQVQNIYDAFHPENLAPDSQTSWSWFQRIFLGGSAHYNRASSEGKLGE